MPFPVRQQVILDYCHPYPVLFDSYQQCRTQRVSPDSWLRLDRTRPFSTRAAWTMRGIPAAVGREGWEVQEVQVVEQGGAQGVGWSLVFGNMTHHRCR